MTKPLEKEFKYYLANQEELVKEYNGKFVVIKGHEVLGDYNSELEAIEKTAANHKIGTFLVQQCLPGKESYTTTFHSRVVLA